MCCKMTWFAQILLATLGALALGLVYSVPADETEPHEKPSGQKAVDTSALESAAEAAPPKDPTGPAGKTGRVPGKRDANGLIPLSKEHDIWLDDKRKAVVIDGEVCLREGQLEMFACPKGTKEHESIVSLNCTAEEAHAALLAAGAKQGTTVKFDPEYKPATGQIIDVVVLWLDEKGMKHKVRAQEWVKHAKTEKELAFDWVFAGSGFWTDEMTGKKHYMANSGDLICVSNFNTATLDLPVESSDANASLMFVAFTDRIPARGTKLRVVLIPRPVKDGKKKKEAGKSAETKPADKSHGE